MKKNINEVLKTITPDTPLEEVLSYCDSIADLDFILSALPHIESKPVPLSAEIKERAINLISESNHSDLRITTSFIQRNLPVSYPQAVALLDWLNSVLTSRKL